MPRSAGTYTPPASTWSPAVNAASATFGDWNSLLTDIANALTQSMSLDGQSTPTGNLPMGGFKLTGLGAGTATGNSLRWEQLFDQGTEATLGSATTTDIGAQNTNFLQITGTTTITSFGANYKGPRFLRFAGALTLTHNASTLILPGGANITTATGDACIVVPIGNPASGWQVSAYQQAAVNTTNAGTYGCCGLVGVNNSGASTTKIDISADAVALRNSSGQVVSRYGTGTLTCDFAAAGPVANGRDQAAAFTNSSWVHLYFIWNGTTLATLASAVAPTTTAGPTLPTGYTHWCFATSVRWGVGALALIAARGSWVTFTAGRTNALSAGSNTSEQTLAISGILPPNATNFQISALLVNNTAGVGSYSGSVRVVSGGSGGGDLIVVSIAVANASGPGRETQTAVIPNISQTIYWYTSVSTVQLYLDVLGYQVANGDV